EIRTLDRIGHGGDFELGLADLFPGRPALADTDGDLAARVAEVQRMGMPLRTIADDGDLLALDELDVAVLIVEDLHLTPRWCSDFQYAFAARDTRCPGPDGLENRRLVERIDECIELAPVARELDRIGLVGHVDDPATEDVRQA